MSEREWESTQGHVRVSVHERETESERLRVVETERLRDVNKSESNTMRVGESEKVIITESMRQRETFRTVK